MKNYSSARNKTPFGADFWRSSRFRVCIALVRREYMHGIVLFYAIWDYLCGVNLEVVRGRESHFSQPSTPR
ncbi:MAG: hypothetical protein LBM92_08450, partial [Opitutaceae bacterium]|nr:hypothetical protein [Opitutaceae bacterium]